MKINIYSKIHAAIGYAAILLVFFDSILFYLDGAKPTLDEAASYDENPHLKDSLTTPIVTAEGHTAMLTCVARNLGDHNLIWRYGNRILTAGSTRVTSDKRFSVIHDEGRYYCSNCK